MNSHASKGDCRYVGAKNSRFETEISLTHSRLQQCLKRTKGKCKTYYAAHLCVAVNNRVARGFPFANHKSRTVILTKTVIHTWFFQCMCISHQPRQ